MTKARIREIRATDPRNPVRMETMLAECLNEIERLQSFSRRGEKPKAEKLPPPAKVKVEKPKSDHHAFIDGWVAAFSERFKETYSFKMGKDGSAVKRLLATGKTVDELLDIAWEAWKHLDEFNCKNSVTIAGFDSRFNNIIVFLKSTKVTAKAPAGASL